MKKKKSQNKVSEPLVLTVILVVMFFLLIFLYQLLNNWAEKSPRICNYIGNIWLAEWPTDEDPNPRRGCYTYQEVYK